MAIAIWSSRFETGIAIIGTDWLKHHFNEVDMGHVDFVQEKNRE